MVVQDQVLIMSYQHKDYYADSEPSVELDGEEMMSNVVDWISENQIQTIRIE